MNVKCYTGEVYLSYELLFEQIDRVEVKIWPVVLTKATSDKTFVRDCKILLSYYPQWTSLQSFHRSFSNHGSLSISWQSGHIVSQFQLPLLHPGYQKTSKFECRRHRNELDWTSNDRLHLCLLSLTEFVIASNIKLYSGRYNWGYSSSQQSALTW